MKDLQSILDVELAKSLLAADTLSALTSTSYIEAPKLQAAAAKLLSEGLQKDKAVLKTMFLI